jgi:hypothetical protein
MLFGATKTTHSTLASDIRVHKKINEPVTAGNVTRALDNKKAALILYANQDNEIL